MKPISPEQLLQQIKTLNAELNATPARPTSPAEGPGFGAVLKQSLAAVNDLQQTSSTLKSGFETGSGNASLVEVMVAIMIVGVALPALIYRIQSVVDHTAHIEQKTYAYWIAENKLQELMLTRRLQKLVPKAGQNDTLEFGGDDWRWEVEVEDTAVEGMFRFDIRVGKEDDRDKWLANLSGFINE